jgi:hypothetical protein
VCDTTLLEPDVMNAMRAWLQIFFIVIIVSIVLFDLQSSLIRIVLFFLQNDFLGDCGVGYDREPQDDNQK